MSRYRAFRYAMCSFLFGVAGGSFLPLGIFESYLFALAAGIVGILGRRNAHVRILALCVFVFAFGIARIGAEGEDRDRFAAPQATPFAVSGIVTQEPTLAGAFQTATFVLSRDDTPAGLMRIRLPLLPPIGAGDRITGTCTAVLPEWTSPGGRPYPPLCIRSAVDITSSSSFSLARALTGVRHAFQDRIDHTIPSPASDLLGGLLLGVDQAFSASLKEDFRRSGVSHIVAVSGFNITIIIAGLWSMLKYARFGRRRSFWLLGVGVVLFVLLTGASPATVRAAVMGLLVLFAQYLGRFAHGIHILLVAVAAMVLWNPMILTGSVGFQLSVAATLGLIVFSPIIAAGIQPMPLWAWFKEVFAQTVAAFLATAPLIIGTFHTVSLVALPANLIIVPLVPLTMAAGFAWSILAFIGNGWVFDALALPAIVLLNAIIWAASFFSHLPFAQVAVGEAGVQPLFVLIPGYAVLAILAWLGKRWLRSHPQEGTIAA